ncbi:hypothetical protein [Deinococcus sp. Leaf326]|jgi:predicted transcriptional regulator|uniref:hypothetical protein n=1 Tax=Deinococcus sp. Leaf326 TaxID=1736338 RepID=UPI0006F5FEE1|nr:hypothetical protein [Deinococcus sp. Leaf326]KQR00511.1 hypothetical protein ASF71_21705 [Deinococcus sp. Leaf326]
MTAPPLTFWQARALLLLTLEPQSVNDVADRIAVRGAVLDLSRVQQVLNELTALGLLGHTLKKGREGGRYWLGSGAAVEDALDQAYEVVKRGPLPQRQK